MNFDRLATVVLACAAVTIAGAMVAREVRHKSSRQTSVASSGPVSVDGWEAFQNHGTWIGDSLAPIQIVEFSDFECPFCRRFHEAFGEVQRQFDDTVALIFVHFPLSMHRFARPAARAAECAGQQGRFSMFTESVFHKQDSLGLKSWVSFAREAGVSDISAYEHCVADTAPVPAIESGLALGERLGVRSTPTVVINGWRYDIPPTPDQMSTDIRALLRGERPSRAGGLQ